MSVSPEADVSTGEPASAGQARPGMSILVSGEDYEGHVVIDTLVNDRSAGGVRIADDLPLEEVRELAREMSLKYALFLLPRGGAKSGIRMPLDLDPERRDAALEDFGRKLGAIIGNGIYSPGMDMNCGPDELRAIYRGAGIELGAVTDTSWFTAMGVYHSVCAAADALAIDGRPVRLSIEGFGSVARHLMDRLDPDRFELVSVATIEGAVRGPFRPADLARARDASGDRFVNEIEGERVGRADVLAEDVDIALPSSRVHSITAEIARDLRAKAVVPIANAPYVDGTIDILSARGVVCLPGYVSNCGGVLASSLADQGLPVPEVEQLFAGPYRQIVDGILRVAVTTGRPGTAVAEELARMHMPERARRVWRSLPQRVYDRFVKPRRPAGMKAASARNDFLRSADRVLGEIAQMERNA
jgi:hypothetical protein